MVKFVNNLKNKEGKIMKLKNYFKIFFILTITFVLTSCSTLNTAISKKNLDVQTKMSDTIWLDPVAPAQKTLYVQIKNTSGKQLEIENKILTALQEKGYRLVSDPDEARYILQANILKVEKVNLREVGGEEAFSNAILAGGIGGILGAQRSGGVYTAIGWGLAASTVATIADALVKDISYGMLTDILITEKTGKNVKVTTRNVIKQGSSGGRTSISEESVNSDKYSTRILSIANKVNLKFEEATPVLERELVKSISGIF